MFSWAGEEALSASLAERTLSCSWLGCQSLRLYKFTALADCQRSSEETFFIFISFLFLPNTVQMPTIDGGIKLGLCMVLLIIAVLIYDSSEQRQRKQASCKSIEQFFNNFYSKNINYNFSIWLRVCVFRQRSFRPHKLQTKLSVQYTNNTYHSFWQFMWFKWQRMWRANDREIHE